MDYICEVQTVVELNEFLRRAEKLLTAEERNNVVCYLAFHPKDGAVMQGTGGIRKLRWRREGKGKSGGFRVVYYYHDESIPLYLLTIFSKGERENLSHAERNALAKFVKSLTEHAKRG